MNSAEEKKRDKNRRVNSEDVDNSNKKSKLTSPKSKENKKIRSLEDLIKSMEPSREELKFREEKLKEDDSLQKNEKLFRCTKCLARYNSLIEKHKKVPIHPILGVLMCQKCCDYYEDGEFSLDSDGEDKYCRWCGEGGTIFGCSKCICGFCATCIKRHFKFEFFKQVQKDDNWLCFFCNPEPLWPLRFVCSQAVLKATENTPLNLKTSDAEINKKDTKNERSSGSAENAFTLPNKKTGRKRVFSSSSDDSEPKCQSNKQKKLKTSKSIVNTSSKKVKTLSTVNSKTNNLMEIEKILKLSEYQLNFGASWSCKMLKKLKSANFKSTNSNLASECRKIKWFLSLLSTYLVQFCNSLNSVEQSLHKDDETKISSDPVDNNQSSYINILQFLDFINKQVKTFIHKGISLSDVLQAEMYEDENIIGIKKTLNSASSFLQQANSTHSDGEDDEREVQKTQSRSEGRVDNSEGLESQKNDSENRYVIESSVDIFDSETEFEKEPNSSNEILVEDIKTSDGEEEIQDILAILENA